MERARLAGNGKHARATQLAYEHCWRDFTAWCAAAGRAAPPASADTVELYLTDLAARCKLSTLQQRAAAIAYTHKAAGLANPVGPGARELLRAMAREKGSCQERKAALTVDELRRMCAKLGRRPQDARDRAVLLLGFASGMRRSELAALELADVAFLSKGVRVRIRRAKNDQMGAGREIGIFRGRRASTCPVRALERYLRVRGRWAGPLFVAADSAGRLTRESIRGEVVGHMVQRCVELIGLDPARYGGHSLRAGMITAAAEAGTPEVLIAQRSGHRSLAVLSRYVRPANIFAFNPLARAL